MFKSFKSKHLNGGIGYTKFFDNGYGVSIVKHSFSYGNKNGLWELAVLEGSEENWDICYDTEITNDVLGHLTEQGSR